MSRDKKVGPIVARSGLLFVSLGHNQNQIKVMKPKIICTHDHYNKESAIAAADTKNCTVYALAAAFEVPYDKAHAAMAPYRKHGVGVTTLSLIQMLTNLVLSGKKVVQRIDHPTTLYASYDPKLKHTWEYGKKVYRKMTVATFAKVYNNGTYYILVRGHALVVKDGVVVDNLYTPKLKQPVMYAFKIG